MVGIPFFLYFLIKVLAWCANYTDTIGKIYAYLFIWLQEVWNLTLIRAPLSSTINTNKDVQTFIGSYSKWFYWVMCLDKYRMRAYQNAIQTLSINVINPQIWLDIGTGAHMPLTYRLLQHPSNIISHVYAVESSKLAFNSATALKKTFTQEISDRITLYNCYSTELKLNNNDIKSQPEAIIHEIIGTVATSEGAVFAIRNTFQMFPKIKHMIPYSFGTLCMPVSKPQVSLSSSLASLLFGGISQINDTKGIVQCLYNPSRTIWMSTSQLVEEYNSSNLFGNGFAPTITRKVLFTINRNDYCSGLFFAPLIHCVDNNNNKIDDKETTINGLLQNTNWGVEYISFGPQNRIFLYSGEQLAVNFEVQINQDCPSYTIKINHIRSGSIITNFEIIWKGPQDNMLI